MKTIGEILKNARVEKNLTLVNLEKITKIKSFFIENVESENWTSLPAFPVVLGFVKSISGVLGLDESSTIAVLKRDYPPKKLSINPKPDVSSKFVWGPKATFGLGVGTVLILIFGYLIYQYYVFVSPPKISLESPKENQVVMGNSVLVFGKTNADTNISVNNQPVIVNPDGKFSVSIEVVSETQQIVVKGVSRSGKETVVSRKIEVK